MPHGRRYLQHIYLTKGQNSNNIQNKNKQKTYKAIRKPNSKKMGKRFEQVLKKRGNPNGYKHENTPDLINNQGMELKPQ